MKQIFASLLIVAAALFAGGCLRIETRAEEPVALCMPVAADGLAVDVTAPHSFVVADWDAAPVLVCLTTGALAAELNRAYNPGVTDRADVRHYEYILTIPQPDGPVVFALNWPDTYR